MTDLKLGVALWSQVTDWPQVAAAARQLDGLGYDHLWTWDHLYAPTGDPYQPVFEGTTLLAALAAITEHVELGLFVGANTFRNPGLVAKAAATLDHVSGGRAIVGLGAAWFELEHERTASTSERARASGSAGSTRRRARSAAFLLARRCRAPAVPTTAFTSCATAHARCAPVCRS